MGETVQFDNQQNRVKKWTRAGSLFFWANLIMNFYFLGQEIYLIPPLFHWSLPIYLLAWFPFIILWVLFTPAKKRLLLLFIPGILYMLLAIVSFAPNLLEEFYFVGISGHNRCLNLSNEKENLYACNAIDFGNEAVYFYHGPKISLFLTPTENVMPTNLNLSGVNMAGKFLRGFDLSGSQLVGANLENANLTMSDLSKANLKGANLTRANLAEADLIGANFESAVLVKTNLTGANVDLEALETAEVISEIILPDKSIYTR